MVNIVTDSKVLLGEVLEWVQQQSIVAIDTEGTGLDPREDQVLLFQIGNEHKQYVVDVYRVRDSFKSFLEQMNSPHLQKVFHNAIYDYSMIKGIWGVELSNLRCTLIGNRLLTMGRLSADNSLAGLMKKYYGQELSKEVRKSFQDMTYGDDFDEDQLKYAADDVKVLLKLYNTTMKLLKERGMDELVELEFKTLKITADLSLNGIYINKEKWLQLEKDAVKESNIYLEKLNDYFRKYCPSDLFGNLIFPQEISPLKSNKGKAVSINYNSSTQIKALFRNYLGSEFKNLDSTDAKILEKYEHPVVKDLLQYKKFQKLISTYGIKFIEENVSPKTQRIHSSFKQLGADTGRYSSTKPNLQNIPAANKYREPFEAQKDGWVIISADFSGQELRLLAHLSQEKEFIKALKENKDLHSYSASLIYNLNYDDFLEKDEDGNMIMDSAGDPRIKKEMKDKYRTPAKSINFGIIYGMGPKKLASKLDIDFREAKALIQKYFEIFKDIKKLMDTITSDVKKNGYALSYLDGRRRDLSHIDWDDGFSISSATNEAKNMPFQGCGASVTKMALCNIDQKLKELQSEAYIINVVHDEILVEAPEAEAEMLAKMIQEEMVKAFNYYAPSVPMSVAPAIGKCWLH